MLHGNNTWIREENNEHLIQHINQTSVHNNLAKCRIAIAYPSLHSPYTSKWASNCPPKKCPFPWVIWPVTGHLADEPTVNLRTIYAYIGGGGYCQSATLLWLCKCSIDDGDNFWLSNCISLSCTGSYTSLSADNLQCKRWDLIILSKSTELLTGTYSSTGSAFCDSGAVTSGTLNPAHSHSPVRASHVE